VSLTVCMVHTSGSTYSPISRQDNDTQWLGCAPCRISGPLLRFETGRISEESMEPILNSLPVDITFIDETDTVRLFPNNADRIFTRPKTIIGRNVQNCYPPASVHVVEKLLDSFRNGEKDMEEFWLELQGRFVYIRYIAVRDRNGDYRGTLEVTQDAAHIRQLAGEKRLLS